MGFVATLAAAIQSYIGAVRAGLVFAFCQSVAVGGSAFTAVVETTSLAAAAASGSTLLVNLENWTKSNIKVPSCSWKDGEAFVPCPEVLSELLVFEGDETSGNRSTARCAYLLFL